MKADLHIHTCYSSDCNSSIEDLINQCRKLLIDCVAVTDHGTIDGAIAMKESAPFQVIIGEEILSTEGEIIGYFLTETVPSGLSAEETIRRIKAQGGLVCLPHPFDSFGRYPLTDPKRSTLIDQIDIIEVFNARSLSESYSRKSRAFAKTNNKASSAGSDAHAPRELGKAYVDMPPFEGPDEFMISLGKGKIVGRKNGVKDHFLTTLGTLPKRIRHE